jgi:archaellum component FlaF (FlaF/FlaG flagellin family)
MESVLVFIICAALAVFGGMTLSQNFLNTVDSGSNGLLAMEQTQVNILKTNLSSMGAISVSSSVVDVTLKNSGQTKLADYDKWDVIVQYTDVNGIKQVRWIPYSSSGPGNNQWTAKGIYLDAGSLTPEVYDIGILNPGEEIVLETKLDPALHEGSANVISVNTPNGVSVTTIFNGP